MAGALALFAAATNLVVYTVAAVLLGVASGAARLAPALWLADRLPPDDRPLGVGVYRTMGDAGAAIGPPLIGLLADRGQDRVTLLTVALALIAVTVLFVAVAPRGPRPDSSALSLPDSSVHD